MSAFIADWLNLLVRWLHVVTGVAWIGASFYFIWLDNHLMDPKLKEDADKGVGGEVWSVHGGGFYHAQKYRVAPQRLPETLHWFKWEAYSTWLSGMFLLVLVYWYGAQVYLIDPEIAQLTRLEAVGLAASIIVVSWLIYDLLGKSRIGQNEQIFIGVLFVLVSLLAWGLCQLFSGRGAYIHFGAVLGTIMVANVYFVIIPGQRRMVTAATNGADPDSRDGVNAKQRSVHNTYFTLPVLFVMTSNHFAMTYGHEYNWAILIAVSLAGALIRVYFVARHSSRASPWSLVMAVLLLAAVAGLIAPRATAISEQAVTLAEVRTVIAQRCTMCHSASPTHPAFAIAPGGVELDNDTQIMSDAVRIHQQTVVTRVMPIGNLTNITELERSTIDRWYRSLEKQD